MLRFRLKRYLLNEITDALIRHRDTFREKMKAESVNLVHTSGKADAVFQATNDQFFTAVAQDVTASVQFAYPQAAVQLTRALENPALAGCDQNNGQAITCEQTYAICYWALQGKVAPTRDLLAVRQLQNLAIQDVLSQLSREAT